jgi:hypothetical protein
MCFFRLKMSDYVNSFFNSLLCHRGENDHVFPIGGLVEPDETLMGNVIRQCRHLAIYRIKPNDCLYMAKLRNGFMNHDLVNISIYITHIHYRDFR